VSNWYAGGGGTVPTVAGRSAVARAACCPPPPVPSERAGAYSRDTGRGNSRDLPNVLVRAAPGRARVAMADAIGAVTGSAGMAPAP
jgi:hypothetical protein